MRTALILLIPGLLSVRADDIINNWTNPASARWDASTNWSVGALPASNQSVNITNAGYKAVNIDFNTLVNFPESMDELLLETAGVLQASRFLRVRAIQL